jgi:hypothetical protein
MKAVLRERVEMPVLVGGVEPRAPRRPRAETDVGARVKVPSPFESR